MRIAQAVVQLSALALLSVAAVGSAISFDEANVCTSLNVPGGVVNLNQARSAFLRDIPFSGDPGVATTADLGIGICHRFDSSNHPCRGHSQGYFSLSAVTPESPVCIATFTKFTVPYFWNGETIEGHLQDSSGSVSAHVFLNCAPNANTSAYNAMVAESSSGKEFNISIATPIACPGPAGSTCPVLLVGHNRSVNLQTLPTGILENVPFEGDNGVNTTIDLGIGLCSAVNASGTACGYHTDSFFTLSAVVADMGQDSICLAAFDTFTEGWSWNGTAIVAALQSRDASLTANVALFCIPSGPPYFGAISEDIVSAPGHRSTSPCGHRTSADETFIWRHDGLSAASALPLLRE